MRAHIRLCIAMSRLMAILPAMAFIIPPGPLVTPFQVGDAARGYSPMPTKAPAVHAFDVRQATINGVGANTCGWVGGDQDAPLTCNTARTCMLYQPAVGPQMAGCCVGGNDVQECGWNTGCVDYTAWQTASSSIGDSTEFLIVCSQSTARFCQSWTYAAYGNKDYGCGTNSASSFEVVSDTVQQTGSASARLSVLLTRVPEAAVTGWQDGEEDPTTGPTTGPTTASSTSTTSVNPPAAPTTPASPKKSTPVGAIVGGVVGGVGGLALIAAIIVFFFYRRKRTNKAPTAPPVAQTNNTYYPPPNDGKNPSSPSHTYPGGPTPTQSPLPGGQTPSGFFTPAPAYAHQQEGSKDYTHDRTSSQQYSQAPSPGGQYPQQYPPPQPYSNQTQYPQPTSPGQQYTQPYYATEGQTEARHSVAQSEVPGANTGAQGQHGWNPQPHPQPQQQPERVQTPHELG